MDPSPSTSDADLWAARIIKGYTDRARPEMSAAARVILRDHLARRLAPAIASALSGDWPETANAALDGWEDEARTAGPRVEAFEDLAERVRFRAVD